MPTDTEEEIERRPSMKVLWMEHPEDAKTEAGFASIREGKKGPEATYVNKGRIQFEHPDPSSPTDAEGTMQRGKYGGWYMWRVTDYDHGHQMVIFFGERQQKQKDTEEMVWITPYVVRDLQRHIKEVKLTTENWKKFLFEVGKTKAKSGSQGKWYVRLISTTADTPGLFDDPENDRYKDVFELRKNEEAIIAKVNKLVEKSGVPKEFTKDMFIATFTSGAAGPPTSESRANMVWDMAKTEPDKVNLHPDLVKFVKGQETK